MLLEHLVSELDEKATELRHKLEELSGAYHDKATLLSKKLRELRDATDEQRRRLLNEVRELKKELRDLWKSWVALTTETTQEYRIAHA